MGSVYREIRITGFKNVMKVGKLIKSHNSNAVIGGMLLNAANEHFDFDFLSV